METKFNVGDMVYACEPRLSFVIYAPIYSIEITEEVFGLEKAKEKYEDYREVIDEQNYIDKHTRKAIVITYIFKIQDNLIKIPEWIYLHSTQTNEVKQMFPLIFSTKEELDKYFTLLK